MLILNGSLEYKRYNQELNTTQSNIFIQNTLSSGLTFIPITGLNINYNYYLKQLTSPTKRKGYQDLIEIKYTPIKYSNFELQTNFKKTKNWGYGFKPIGTMAETIGIYEKVK